MQLSVIKKIRKYLRIYAILFRFGFIFSTTYRVSFFIELLVEIGYQIAFILFYFVIFNNIKNIMGWNFYEIMFLTGLNIVTSELILGSLYIFNLRRLPEKIKNGDIDLILVKPINSLFYLSLGIPYFSAFVSIIPGILLMIYSYNRLNLPLNFFAALVSIFVLINGFILAFSFSIILSSLSFKYINTYTIPLIAEKIILYYKDRPHQVYQGILKLVFFIIIPVVFVSSIPSYILIKNIVWNYVMVSLFLSCIFFFIALKVWEIMIKNYTSASS